MGKTSRKWFCACFGNHNRGGRSDGHDSSTSACHLDNESDQNKHAIAVAVATTAVAEAAVAAAQAAAAVVRLTSSSGRCGSVAHVSVSNGCRVVGAREDWVVAVVKIQSAFRGYLAKRALRALKGLVKLQALARGHIVRKRTEDAWRRMQALLRAQSRVCAERALVSESPHSSTKSSQFHNLGPATPEKTEHIIRAKSTRHKRQSMLKRNVSKSKSNRTSPIDDEKSATILEIDSHFTPKRRNLFHSFHLNHHHQTLPYDQNSYYSCTTSKDSTCQTVPSQSSFCEVHSLGPFTPTKSDGLKSYYNPSYMAYTESSKAKSRRSLTAPKQRPKIERSRSVNRYLRSSERKVSALHANFAARDYPGSGQLNKFGLPMRVMT